MIEVREYLDAKGNSPYTKWFDRLNATAAVKVATAIHRMEQGNFSKEPLINSRCRRCEQSEAIQLLIVYKGLWIAASQSSSK